MTVKLLNFKIRTYKLTPSYSFLKGTNCRKSNKVRIGLKS